MKLLFLGDFYYDYDYISEDIMVISEYLKEKQYNVILNYEAAPGRGGKPITKRGPNLRHSDVSIDVLKMLSVKGVCLANNHAMDYGQEALIDGIKILDEANILHVGAGANKKNAIDPMRLVCDGQEILISNFGWDVEETVYATDDNPGCSPINHNLVVAHTKQLRRDNPTAIIINVFHWGFEFNTRPMPYDIDFAHKCIDEGADLIIGHHPHVVQSKETYQGKEIYYSLGNFYFSSRRDSFTKTFASDAHENMCDYGIGVVFDTMQRTSELIQIEYISQIKQSILSENITCINDITGKNWLSSDYSEEAKKHSEGINPILGVDEEENRKKLKKLFFRYSVAKKLSFLKQNKAGAAFYKLLKRISN